MAARIEFTEIPNGLMTTMLTAEKYIISTGFDIKLRELIKVRVSYINQCAYCIDMHFKEAMAAGEELKRLYSVTVWKDTNYYTPKEQACLAWAEYITLPSGKHAESKLFEQLLAFFDKEEIANLTLLIAQINSWNRLMKSFDIEAGNYEVSQK